MQATINARRNMDYYAEHHRPSLFEMGHRFNEDVKETVKSINLQMIFLPSHNCYEVDSTQNNIK